MHTLTATGQDSSSDEAFLVVAFARRKQRFRTGHELRKVYACSRAEDALHATGAEALVLCLSSFWMQAYLFFCLFCAAMQRQHRVLHDADALQR